MADTEQAAVGTRRGEVFIKTLKWLTIGWLGTFAIGGLLLTAWVWHFSPIIIDKGAGLIDFGGNFTIRANEKDLEVKCESKLHRKGDKVTVDGQGSNIKNR